MNIQINDLNEPYIQEKIDNQTFRLIFEFIDQSLDTLYFNVHLGVFNKRKHAIQNENQALITGTNPFKIALFGRKAFLEIEEYVIDSWIDDYNIHISCVWVDNRRRDTYYKFLSRYGYEYGKLDNQKVIYKLFKKEDYTRDY